MTVADLINVISYNYSKPIMFQIEDEIYTYDDIKRDRIVQSMHIDTLQIESNLFELTSDDVIRLTEAYDIDIDDIEILLPANSYSYTTVVTINEKGVKL